MIKKLSLILIKTILPLLLGAYLIWRSFSGMTVEEEKQFYHFIQEANYFWIFASLIFGFIAYLSRAFRWNYTLEPLGFKSNFWNRYHAIMIGYLINLTIPRAGEASRSAMLYRSDGVPFSNSFGTIIAERAVDFIVLVGIGCITLFLGYSDFLSLKNEIQNYFTGTAKSSDTMKNGIRIAVLLVVTATIIVMYYKPALRSKIVGFVSNVFSGLFSIFKLKRPISYLFHTAVIWMCYLMMFSITFLSSEITSEIPVQGILLAFIAGSLGIILTNGGIGSYPILVGLVVAFYLKDQYPDSHVAFGIGNALGWIIWLSQTLLMVILGVISFILLPKNYKDEQTPVHTVENSDA